MRGTDSTLAPVPPGTVTHDLMHTTDWLPTLVGLAGGTVEGAGGQHVDGVDQWPTISKGTPTTRKFIIHNVPITADPVLLPPGEDGKAGGFTTSVCLSAVDNRTGPCHAFGVTGGAIRVGDFKLLVSHPTRAPWEDSSPAGIGQGTPGGRFPNRTNVFTPATPPTDVQPFGNVYDEHLKRNISVYLFNIKQDPTESNNLANTSTAKLKELLDFYNDYAAANDTVMGLSWRYGFQDTKASGTVPPTPDGQRCTGAICCGPAAVVRAPVDWRWSGFSSVFSMCGTAHATLFLPPTNPCALPLQGLSTPTVAPSIATSAASGSALCTVRGVAVWVAVWVARANVRCNLPWCTCQCFGRCGLLGTFTTSTVCFSMASALPCAPLTWYTCGVPLQGNYFSGEWGNVGRYLNSLGA